jgi:hypothetical protein
VPYKLDSVILLSTVYFECKDKKTWRLFCSGLIFRGTKNLFGDSVATIDFGIRPSREWFGVVLHKGKIKDLHT